MKIHDSLIVVAPAGPTRLLRIRFGLPVAPAQCSMAKKAPAPYSPSESWQRFGMLFSWWKSQTLGTWVQTKLYGSPVGTDDFGNRYYQNKDGSRRWVLYNGTVEASRVPPDWHGWMHHTFAEPPTKAPLRTQSWETPHLPNLTGTDQAFRPEGSLQKSGRRPAATGDYQAWKPE